MIEYQIVASTCQSWQAAMDAMEYGWSHFLPGKGAALDLIHRENLVIEKKIKRKPEEWNAQLLLCSQCECGLAGARWPIDNDEFARR